MALLVPVVSMLLTRVAFRSVSVSGNTCLVVWVVLRIVVRAVFVLVISILLLG